MLTKRQQLKVMQFAIDGVPIVQDFHYEGNFGDTQIWVNLKNGYNFDGCSSCVADDSEGKREMFRMLMSDLNQVVKGDCY